MNTGQGSLSLIDSGQREYIYAPTGMSITGLQYTMLPYGALETWDQR
jgi:hypothetical protein